MKIPPSNNFPTMLSPERFSMELSGCFCPPRASSSKHSEQSRTTWRVLLAPHITLPISKICKAAFLGSQKFTIIAHESLLQGTARY